MEVSNDVIQKTQKTLGKYVKKPPLAEKLLKKPPFRFLHDIIKTVIKETGYLGNLFTETELNYESVKEKDAKIAFLTKLIDAIKHVSETQLAVKPSKIVAGLEPGETNKLLQALARAIDKKADISGYLEKVKNAENNAIQKDSKTKKATDKKTSSKPVADKVSKKPSEANLKLKRSSSRDSEKSSTKLTDRKESSRDKKTKEESSKTKNTTSPRKNTKEPKTIPTEKGEPEQVIKNRDIESNVTNNNSHIKGDLDANRKIKSRNSVEEVEQHKDKDVASLKVEEKEVDESSKNIVSKNDNENDNVEAKNRVVVLDSHDVMKTRQPSASLIRPKSARIKPQTPLKPDHNLQNSELAPPSEQRDSSPPPQKSTTNQRPKSSLRPPSVRPSSARPGAPRLRPDSALPVSETVTMGNINVIVESFDNADDEETVVIQNSVDTMETENGTNDTTPLGLLMESGENKGQLVEQILEQIQESEIDKKKIQHVDWEQDSNTKDATAKDINHLRSLIQSLTKTANPLGKLLNYLHEDLEAMHNELQMWTNSKTQLYAEIEKQKKINADHSKPLLVQLMQMQQEIRKYEQDIMVVKANIFKNDLRIKELVSK